MYTKLPKNVLNFYAYSPCIFVLTTSIGLLTIVLQNPAKPPAIKSATKSFGISLYAALFES